MSFAVFDINILFIYHTFLLCSCLHFAVVSMSTFCCSKLVNTLSNHLLGFNHVDHNMAGAALVLLSVACYSHSVVIEYVFTNYAVPKILFTTRTSVLATVRSVYSKHYVVGMCVWIFTSSLYLVFFPWCPMYPLTFYTFSYLGLPWVTLCYFVPIDSYSISLIG